MQEIDQPGSFYLGRDYDLAAGKVGTTPLLYQTENLTTHAVCVGMTGSGKTGLCLSLLEEAAIDGIPAICDRSQGGPRQPAARLPGTAAERLPAVDRSERRLAEGDHGRGVGAADG